VVAKRKGSTGTITKYKLDVDDEGFRSDKEGREIRKVPVKDSTTTQEALNVRQSTYQITSLVPGNQYKELTKIYTKKSHCIVARNTRRPTMGEVRHFDKEMHLAIHSVMTDDPEDSLAEGFQWYLDNRSGSLWELLEALPQHRPDQSIQEGVEVESTQPKKKSYSEVDLGIEKPRNHQLRTTSCGTRLSLQGHRVQSQGQQVA